MKETIQKNSELFEITPNEQQEIINNFLLEMDNGLAGEESSLQMLSAFTDTPTGNEKGKYFALDVGGTNFRILMLNLDGNGGMSNIQATTPPLKLTKEIINGKKDDLFDFIAREVKNFLIDKKIEESEKIKLGFTFSFPIKQTGVASGTLINWAKEFNVSGVVGHDIVELLKEAFQKININNIEVKALVNDTVGTLAAGRYQRPDCDLGVILGTGTNAAYRESGDLKGTMINIEWGNFNKIKQTEKDKQLDDKTVNSNRYIMEKMVSGKYLGDLSLLLIDELIKNNKVSVEFAKSWNGINERQLDTKTMSDIEMDDTPNLEKVEVILEDMSVSDSMLSDRKIIKDIIKSISNRSAKIVASAIFSVLKKIDPQINKKHSVAVDGSLYESYFGYKEKLQENLDILLGEKAGNIELFLCKDGSGVGAAIIAASVQ